MPLFRAPVFVKYNGYVDVDAANEMEARDVDRWEELIGEIVRIKGDCTAIHAIGHIIEDKWFEPEKAQE